MIYVQVEIPTEIVATAEIMLNSTTTSGVVAVNYSDGTPSPLGDISSPGAVNIPQHGIRNTDDSLHFDDEFDASRVFPDTTITKQDDTLFANVPAGTDIQIMNSKIQRRLANDTVELVGGVTLQGVHVIEKTPIIDGNDVSVDLHVWNKTIKIGALVDSVVETADQIMINPVVPIQVGTLFFPAVPIQTTQYSGKKDIGYFNGIGAYDYTPPAYPLRVMALDQSHADFPHRLTENNQLSGTTHRWVTDDGTPATDGKGGFVVGDFATSTPWYVIDMHTGDGLYIVNIGLKNWADGHDAIDSLVVGPYSDFRPLGRDELAVILDPRFYFYLGGNILKRGEVSGYWNSQFVCSDTTEAWGTTGCVGVSVFSEFKIFNKTTAYTMYAIRKHF